MNKKIKILISILIIFLLTIIFVLSNKSQVEHVFREVSYLIGKGIINVIDDGEMTMYDKIVLLDNIVFAIRKLVHFVVYAILGMLTYYILYGRNRKERRNFKLSFTIVFIISIIDEIYQGIMPDRSFKLLDIFIDSVGIIVGVLIMWSICRIYKKVKIDGWYTLKNPNNITKGEE